MFESGANPVLRCGLALLLLAAPALPAQAAGIVGPFGHTNQYPLAQALGLPAPASSSVLGNGQTAWEYVLDHANHLSELRRGGESLLIDGESLRATLGYRQGIVDGLEWNLELPVIHYFGGVLDHFIDQFHNELGFPDNRRSDVRDNRIRYRYLRNGRRLLDIDDSAQGVGDLRLGLTAAVDPRFLGGETAVGLSVKLPTGDEDRLTGSGTTDVAVWGAFARAFPHSNWSAGGSVGWLHAGGGGLLEEIRERDALFGHVRLGYRPREHFGMLLQLNAHSALYRNTELAPLGTPAIQGLIGFEWRFGRVSQLAFALAEDLHHGATEDVALHLALRLTSAPRP